MNSKYVCYVLRHKIDRAKKRDTITRGTKLLGGDDYTRTQELGVVGIAVERNSMLADDVT